MKILVIGDFHGKFPSKLKKIAKGKDIDLIVSVGDFPESEKIRKIIFKSWIDKPWYEVIGLKKARILLKESFNSGLKILNELNSAGKKTYFIWGNTDFYKDQSMDFMKSLDVGFYNDKLKKLKNLILTDRKKRKLKQIEVIGFGGYLDVTEYIKNPITKDQKRQKKTLKRYKKSEDRLKKLFLENKIKKSFIFLIHYTPYGIFDKVKFKGSPMDGKHVGFEPYNKIIKKYRPSLVVCGHMHEYQGIKKLYGIPIINPGAAVDGKAAIIELDDQKGKVKNVRFLR